MLIFREFITDTDDTRFIAIDQNTSEQKKHFVFLIQRPVFIVLKYLSNERMLVILVWLWLWVLVERIGLMLALHYE